MIKRLFFRLFPQMFSVVRLDRAWLAPKPLWTLNDLTAYDDVPSRDFHEMVARCQGGYKIITINSGGILVAFEKKEDALICALL